MYSTLLSEPGRYKFRVKPFLKGLREWRGQSPGVRMKSGHLKNRLPAIRRGRHFPQAGNRAFSQVVRLFSVAVYRPLSRKAGTSENCGLAGISRRRETALFHRLYAYFTLLIITTYLKSTNLRKLWFRALHEMRAMPYGPQTIF